MHLFHSRAAAGIHLNHMNPPVLEIFLPGFILTFVSQIRLIQEDQPCLILAQTVNIRIPAGNGNPSIHQLNDQIDQFQILLHLSFCFGHMTGIPLYIHICLTSHKSCFFKRRAEKPQFSRNIPLLNHADICIPAVFAVVPVIAQDKIFS